MNIDKILLAAIFIILAGLAHELCDVQRQWIRICNDLHMLLEEIENYMLSFISRKNKDEDNDVPKTGNDKMKRL